MTDKIHSTPMPVPTIVEQPKSPMMPMCSNLQTNNPSIQNTNVVVSQPQMQQPVVTVQAPRGLGYPQGLRPWSTGFCGCFDDIPTCKSL